jgi:hypothetical protein
MTTMARKKKRRKKKVTVNPFRLKATSRTTRK